MKKAIQLIVYNMVCLVAVSAQITISYDASGNMTRKQIVADLPELTVIGASFTVARLATYAVTPATATSNYQWQITGGYVVSGQGSANATVQWLTETEGTVSVTERNQRSCAGQSASMLVKMQQKHEIRLAAGWNFISTFLHPTNDSLTAITADISNQLLAVRNLTGSFTPNEPLSTLWQLSEGQAYFAKMSAAATMTILGKSLNDNSLSLSIPANQWFYLGYPLDTVLGIRTALATILPDILGVKTVTQSFNPAEIDTFNTLKEMRPGNGYFIKVRNAVTLTYPAYQVRSRRVLTDNTIVAQPHLPADWQLVPYPSSMVAYGQVTLDDLPVSETDKIGVFVGNTKLLYHHLRYTNQHGANPTTEYCFFKWRSFQSK
jgi:hypothetical protein